MPLSVPLGPGPRLRQALFALLALTLFTVPLVFFTGTQDQFELPKLLLLRAFTSLMLGVALAALLAEGPGSWCRTPLDWPVLAWTLWQLAKTAHSVSTPLSWRGEYENFGGSLTQLNYSAVYFLAAQAGFRPGAARRLARTVLAGALGAALYALLQAQQRDFVQWSAASVVVDRFFGPLGNPNFLAGLMAMAIPLKLALAWGDFKAPDGRDRDGVWRWGLLGLLLLTYVVSGRLGLLDPGTPRPGGGGSSAWVLGLWLLALVAEPLLRLRGQSKAGLALAQAADVVVYFQVLANTGTRGGFLGLMLGAAALVLGWLRLNRGGAGARRGLLRAGLALGLLALGLGLAIAALGGTFRARTLATLRDPGKALEISRLEIWVPAVKIWRDHPLTGTGVDTFKTVFPGYSRSRFNHYDGDNVASRMAHCEPLQILATEGLLGLALWAWFCSAYFAAAARGLGRPDAERAVVLGLAALGAAYLGQNLVSFGVAAISLPFWAAAGLLSAAATPVGDGPATAGDVRGPRLDFRAALAAGAVLALLGLWLDGQTLRADMDYAFANQAQGGLSMLDQASLEECHSAAGWTLDALDHLDAPLGGDLAQDVEGWRRQLDIWERALQQSPDAGNQLLPLYRRGAGALLMALSIAHLERAVALCPGEVKYQVYLGLCYEELYRRSPQQRQSLWFHKAEASYILASAMNPRNGYYHGNLGRLYAEASDSDPTAYPQAAAEYGRALDCAPATRLFYENLLFLQAHFADLDGADKAMRRVKAADPELAPPLLMAAASTFFQWRDSPAPAWTAERKARVLPQALDWAKQAAALDPGNADYAESVAVFAQASGQRDEAARWSRLALRLNPRHAEALRFVHDHGY